MLSSSNISLKPFNTFGIDVKAKKYLSVETMEELKSVLQQHYASELFILGGGSNMLLTKDIDKTVVHLNLSGKKVLEETSNEVIVQAMAGENWHQFVMWCLEKGFGGLENLSLIPGNVGTAPIQNIGAYGVELKDSFSSCTALDVQSLEEKNFTLEECRFGYRESVFKSNLRDKFIITSVRFRLSKNGHTLKTSYGAIDTFLEKEGIKDPSIKDVSNAVIKIRQSKLPDPRFLGNSGSFFKNPVISNKEFSVLLEKFPEVPHYPMNDELVKIPAGWLIERAGLKGYREGNAGVHEKQALVLVNYGNATGQEVLNLSKKVQQKIKEKFQIELQPEVNIF